MAVAVHVGEGLLPTSVRKARTTFSIHYLRGILLV